jgi:hypothetical protein
MIPRSIAFAAVLLAASSALAQSPHDWHYHELPNGPTAPGVHRVLGHHKQRVPFYSPMQSPESFGPRTHLRYGWFGRYTPSPRPATRTVNSRSPVGS